jgi:site-specific DNA-cytosine methylase
VNELSLFSGAGGGLLGTMLLGFRPIGYVEWDDYCQRVLAARIRDGILPDAPILGDIKTFIDSGCAELYRGVTDVITAGFPCQPFSVAGKQKGADDERNMWPSTAIVIGIVKPRFVLLENVPGVRTYLPVVVRDLRRLGYEVSRPLILGADDVGAPHRRKRIWIMAHTGEVGAGDFAREIRADRGRGIGRDEPALRQTHWENGADRVDAASGLEEMAKSVFTGSSSIGREIHIGPDSGPADSACPSGHVAHSPQRQDDGRERGKLDGTAGGRKGIDSAADFGGQDVADAGLLRQKKHEEQAAGTIKYGAWWASDPADTICVNGHDAGHGAGEVCGECESSEICGLSRWGLKSRVGRVVNGCPDRIHRLKALGNMQVSSVVATAWRILTS